MASRVMPTRSRPTTRSKPNDENALHPSTSAGAVGVAGLKSKPSTGSLAGVKKSAVVDKVAAAAAGVKAGAKRPALGNISNSHKDPHVDTEAPMKASKISSAAPTRSRSASLSREHEAKKPAAAGKPAARVPLATSTSVNGVTTRHNTHSAAAAAAAAAGAVRPTAKLPKSKASSAPPADHALATDDERELDEYADARSEDVTMVDARLRASASASGSGLTPSINGMLVKAHDLSSVAEDPAPESDMMDDFDAEEGAQDDEELDEEDWLALPQDVAEHALRTLERVRETFEDESDLLDTTMVAEYAEDIFDYMGVLEERAMPNPRYMEHQGEIEWGMRTTLVDWLLQVHLRYHMLPETLWIAVNIVDRFLSTRVVSLVKLQLVGVTAMFVAAKYEEILAPSVDEFVYMTENGYTKDEILKGERIILQTLDFDISSYCSPYSWVRRISKADDYDIQTRTLSKFLMEVTLLDHRFLRAKPSLVAAIGMYLARRMLDGDWNDAFIYYSNFTESQILPGAEILCELLSQHDFEKQYVYKKYANKKFLRASTFARDWAKTHVSEDGVIDL